MTAPSSKRRSLVALERDIPRCDQCDRLVAWRERVSVEKRAAYRDDHYWGRPVQSFGDPKARVGVIGLAPAAHGANRTGRMFTGDRSGDWLYRALHETGFANQAASVSRDDGLVLEDCWVTSVVRCAPPDNKPAREERDRCRPYFVTTLRLLPARTLVALGGFAWDNTLWALGELGHRVRPKPKFGHGAEVTVGPWTLIGSYHPSQQNTFTKRLTRPMLRKVFTRARALAVDSGPGA